MIDRQKDRPSVQEFERAVLSFLENNYKTEITCSVFGVTPVVVTADEQRNVDIGTIRREQRWEGLPGTPESIEQFAVRQLARYQRIRGVDS